MRLEAQQQVEQLRIAGEKALLSKGISTDRFLVSELRSPGSDQRCGVNFIARPPADIVEGIEAIQQALRQVEPDQYYYPAGDLHLTLLEICSARPSLEAEEIASTILDKLDVPTCDVIPRVDSPLLVYNDKACAVNFISSSEALMRTRVALTAQLARYGVTVNTRHPPQAAHVTILRYTAPLRTSVQEWTRRLQGVCLDSALSWDIDTMWLTWGANWYGMSSRVRSAGPFAITRSTP